MLGLQRLGSTLRDLNRLREILQAAAAQGFGFLIDRLQLGTLLPSRQRVCKLPRERPTVPARVRNLFETLGPVFIKFGQMLSQRSDMLPAEFITELSKLQDQVPPFPFTEVEHLIAEEFHAPVRELFRSIDPRPLAAASIAQVHRAVTNSGEAVAVKVQRPGLSKVLEADLEILRLLAGLWETWVKEEMPRRPIEMVAEFERLLREELDFHTEGRHVERLAANFRKRPAYRFPRVYWELSSARVLTLEYIDGRKLTELPAALGPEKRRRLAQVLIDAYIDMALEDRFFHADPHPGNFLLDAKGRLCFLDAGQVGRLDKETVDAFTDMLLALVDQDTDLVVEAYLRLGTAGEHVDRRSLKKDVGIFLEQYFDLPVEKLSFGRSLQDLITLALKYQIQLPADFVVLAKTFLGAESLARQLHPQLNLVAAAQPKAKRLLAQRLSPRTIAAGLWTRSRVLVRFLLGLPDQLTELLVKLQRGHLKIEFEHKGLEDLQHSLDRSSNRLSFALIVASLIIASSLLLFSKTGPSWGGFSILGLLGYVVAGLFGFFLLIGILRSGRM